MVLQGMQELNRAAPQAAGGETDPETQQAVQRVLTVVRGTSNGATPELTLDDVVRFYNVSSALPAPLHAQELQPRGQSGADAHQEGRMVLSGWAERELHVC